MMCTWTDVPCVMCDHNDCTHVPEYMMAKQSCNNLSFNLHDVHLD